MSVCCSREHNIEGLVHPQSYLYELVSEQIEAGVSGKMWGLKSIHDAETPFYTRKALTAPGIHCKDDNGRAAQ